MMATMVSPPALVKGLWTVRTTSLEGIGGIVIFTCVCEATKRGSFLTNDITNNREYQSDREERLVEVL